MRRGVVHSARARVLAAVAQRERVARGLRMHYVRFAGRFGTRASQNSMPLIVMRSRRRLICGENIAPSSDSRAASTR